jgi:hypothetical protein
MTLDPGAARRAASIAPTLTGWGDRVVSGCALSVSVPTGASGGNPRSESRAAMPMAVTSWPATWCQHEPWQENRGSLEAFKPMRGTRAFDKISGSPSD